MPQSSVRLAPRSPVLVLSLAAGIVVALAGALPMRAHAALGEPEAAIAADAPVATETVPAASIKAIERATYRIHEIRMPSGVRVREFAPPGGSVFAVTWTGPLMPDLRQALGRYFTVFATAPRATPISRTHFQYRGNGLVIESSGHARAFTGRAYLEQALPAGVSLEELH